MTEFTPWTLFVDCGLIAVLLLIGKLIRVKVRFIQSLFIPPSLLAGFMGLALGPGGFDILPFSDNIGTYAGILIALVFGSLPLSSPQRKEKDLSGRIGSMWAFSQSGMLLQWGICGLFGLFVLGIIWPSLHPSFGVMLPGGFVGGHGTAAALGQAFQQLDYEDARSLAMTTATAGILSAVIGGLIMIKWATHRKYTKFISDFSDLPDELRSGLLPKDKRQSMGEATCSPISIESLTFNLAAMLLVAFGGYLVSKGVSSFFPRLELPVFSCAFIVGLLIRKGFDRFKVSEYICPQTVSRLSSTFTDLLVAFGVASIKLEIVIKYALPLVILIIFGIVFTAFFVLYIGRRLMNQYWFEKSLFTWGWFTGTMAMGIALLRIVDPEMKSKSLEDYAIAYLPIAPIEISLVTFAPLAFVNGYGFWFAITCVACGIAVLGISRLKGWWQKI